MDEKGKMNTEEYEELIKKVEANSPYKRLSSAKKKWMSVSEMGELLGLKKTDRYWLVHKNFFETKEIAGKMRVNIESFEKWYANQIKYHKVNGKKLAQTGERGRNGNLQYLTIDEAAFMAKVSRSMINVWYTKGYFPVVKIRNHVRIKRKEFEAWLEKRNTERGC